MLDQKFIIQQNRAFLCVNKHIDVDQHMLGKNGLSSQSTNVHLTEILNSNLEGMPRIWLSRIYLQGCLSHCCSDPGPRRARQSCASPAYADIFFRLFQIKELVV